MEEIIYLTSLASLDLYPDNKASSFTNAFVYPLNLDSNKEYEIGILSLLCPDRVPVIHKGYANDGLRISVTSPEGEIKSSRTFLPRRTILTLDMESIIDAINSEIVTWLTMYLNVSDAISEILPHDEKVLKWDGTNVIINRKVVRPQFKEEKLSPWVKHLVGKVDIEFNPGLARIIGFSPRHSYPIFEVVDEINTPIINPSQPQPTNGIEYIYVYCDILQPTPFGGKLTNVLDCFDFHKGYNKSVKNVIYRSLNVKYIPSISLKMADQWGRDIHFPKNSSITAILHIREKKTLL